MANLKTITAARTTELVREGAVLIDIREAHEHARENIPGARHHALSQIDTHHPVRAGDTVLIYHCKSGGRTNLNAQRLAAASGNCQVYLLGGGIEAWKRAGLPTTANPTRAADKPAAGGAWGGILNRLSALLR